MQSPIQSSPLTVDRILRHAAGAYGQAEVVTAAPEGAPRRLGYAQLEARVRRLAGALSEGGVKPGDVVAVIGCATARQLEAWFAIMMTGAACHPINPALPPEDAAVLLRAHGDKTVLVDPELLAALEPSLLKLPQLERVVAMGEAGHDHATRMHAVVSQDALMETAGRALTTTSAEEGDIALLVHSALSAQATAWSHRTCVLQGLTASGPAGLGLDDRETLLVLTPLWRASAAAAVFAATTAGCKLVLPGVCSGVQQIRILTDRETVAAALGSPAELQALHDQFRAEDRRPISLKRVIVTGAPCPQTLVRAWRDSFGVEVLSAWGSAETAGLAAVGRPPAGLLPLLGIELELLDADGRPRPHDGIAIGRLAARGPLVVGAEAGASLDTGDLATIDAQGRVALLGRADEQVIALGAQIPAWPLEAAALEHPATARAAAIDPPRSMAAEGPVLVVERKPGALAGKPEYLRFLGERLGGLRLGELLFVNSFPMDGAGRIDKPGLRRRLEHLMAPPAAEVAPIEVFAAPAPEPPAVVVSAADQAAADPMATLSAWGPEPAEASIAAGAATAAVLFQEEPEPAEAAAPEPEAVVAEVAPEPEPESDKGSEPAAIEPPETLLPQPDEGLELGPLSEPAPAHSAAADEAERPMVLRLDSRPHHDRRKARQRLSRTALFLNLAALLALAPAVMVLAGALGVRFDLIDWRLGVGELMLDWPSKLALIAVLGGVFAIFAAVTAGFRRYGLTAVFALVLPLATLAGVTWLKSLGESYPPVHDVATDWTRPIAFSPALLRARGPDAFPVEADPFVPASSGAYMNRRVAEVNAETCPGAKPATLGLAPAEAYARAKTALQAKGYSLFSEVPADGRLEATAAGLWLALKDDLAVRVTPDGSGSRVDVRSVSRSGVADYGANCRRVTELVRLVGGQPARS